MFKGGGPEKVVIAWSGLSATRAAWAAGLIFSTGETGLVPLPKLAVGLLLDGDIERERFELNTWLALGVVVV